MIDRATVRLVGFIGILMFGALCYGLGGAGHQSYDKPPVAKVETKTVYKDRVKVQTKTETKYVQAEACVAVGKAAESVAEAVGVYEKNVGKETAIQERSYHIRENGTQNEMNKIAEDHRKVISDTLDAALKLQEGHKALKAAMEKCRDYPVK